MLKVMIIFATLSVMIMAVFSFEEVQSFRYWDAFRYYGLGMLIGSIVIMVFLWFVNTDGFMADITSLALFAEIIIGFGIVLGSIILYVLLPSNFSVTTLAFGLGLSTMVFAMGL